MMISVQLMVLLLASGITSVIMGCLWLADRSAGRRQLTRILTSQKLSTRLADLPPDTIAALMSGSRQPLPDGPSRERPGRGP